MICEERDDHIRPGRPGAFAACKCSSTDFSLQPLSPASTHAASVIDFTDRLIKPEFFILYTYY